MLEAFIPGVLTPIKPFQEERRAGAALGGDESSHPALAGCRSSRTGPGQRVPPARAAAAPQNQPGPATPGILSLVTVTAGLAGLERGQGDELLFLCLIPALHIHVTQITLILPWIGNKYPKYEN